MKDFFNSVFDLLNYNFFVLGNAKITPLSVVYLILLTALLVFLSSRLKRLLIAKLTVWTPLQTGARQAIGTISRYVILFVGFIIILQTIGIDLTTFNVIAGAVGIGIGLGLQNIANNFISGLILLLERPINVGDRIEIGSVNGEVVSIGARSTRVLTNDNIAIIVPNSKLVSENVVNWSYEGNKIRFRIPVAVAIDTDIELVTKLLTDAAGETDDVAADPPPVVRCLRFDDSGIYFELRAWSHVRLHRPGAFKSDLNLSIIEKFRQNDIALADSTGQTYPRPRDADREPRVLKDDKVTAVPTNGRSA